MGSTLAQDYNDFMTAVQELETMGVSMNQYGEFITPANAPEGLEDLIETYEDTYSRLMETSDMYVDYIKEQTKAVEDEYKQQTTDVKDSYKDQIAAIKDVFTEKWKNLDYTDKLAEKDQKLLDIRRKIAGLSLDDTAAADAEKLKDAMIKALNTDTSGNRLLFDSFLEKKPKPFFIKHQPLYQNNYQKCIIPSRIFLKYWSKLPFYFVLWGI